MSDDVVEFWRRLRPRLIGSLSLLLGDDGAAEDAAQEALARAWDRWEQVREMGNPEGWTHRVAVNLARSRRRRLAARRHREERSARRSVAGSEDPPVADAIVVRAALQRLPLRQRTALVLRFFDDLSVAETAEVMGCATGTVKSLTHRALAALRADTDLQLERTADGA